jgi:erythromycin esterase
MPGTEFRYPAAGSYLRRWYGAAYVSVGFTLDHGTAGLQPNPTTHLAPAKPSWFEAPLGRQSADHFILDIHDTGPPAVRRWLSGALITRGLPQAGPTSTVSGGSVTQWFDLLVHTQRVTPLEALGHRRRADKPLDRPEPTPVGVRLRRHV